MELELGLALPNQTHNYPMMVDLNCGYNNIKNDNGVMKKTTGKKNFVSRDDKDEEEEVESKGSPFLWSGQPNDDDDDNDDDDGQWRRLHLSLNHGEENDEEIVGWPPINSQRKELIHRHQGGYRRQPDHHHHHHRVNQRNSMYVKVKMEGVPIGRKIDLGLFDSYRALTDALIVMFAKYNGNDDEDYTILYKDREGDWMLAGDVPWETFVESVQRMEIQRKNN